MNPIPSQTDSILLKPSDTRRLDDAAAPPAIRGLRWWIIGLIFLATAINYIDRRSVSLLAPVLERPDQLNITTEQYATVSTILLLSYAISQSLSGRFYDRYGSRVGFTASILVWSAAAMGQSLIGGFYSFAGMTALLGFGEAGNWPGAAKVVAEWFPTRERALGIAIFNSGASTGAIIASPLVVWLESMVGWRWTFFVVGTLGLFWLVAWLLLYKPLETHPRLSAAERDYILQGRLVRKAGHGIAWQVLLQHRKTWAIVIARFLVDPIWWLYVLWLPKYLIEARGLNLKQIGLFEWSPWVAAALGSLFGGWLAGRLIGSGWSVTMARRIVISIAACLMPFGILAAFAATPWAALACIGVVLFGFQMWISNVQTLPSDLVPGSAVGSLAGLAGAAAALGSVAFTFGTGWIVTHYSYTPVLVIAGVIAPVGTLILLFLAGPIEPIALSVDDETSLAK